MKLGVITDGISDGIHRDLEHALQVMAEAGLRYAELQFVWDREIGDQPPEELRRIKALLDRYQVQVSCITRHNFSGLPVMTTTPDDEGFQGHLAGFKRCLAIAQELGAPLVRTMSYRKEMILFGYNGADRWVASQGAWDKLLRLMETPLRLAEEAGITLVVETGNNALITSGALGKKLVDDLGSRHLKVLWDPANTLYCTDVPYPDAYEQIRDCLGHVHIKDCTVDIARATVRFCPLGEGQMARYLEDIAAALKRDAYPGVVSLESVYRPDSGTFEEGFRRSLPTFQRVFGG